MAGNRIDILGTDELKERMSDPKKVIIVDARDEEDYRKMHIPGAISIPVYDIERLSDTLDKEKEVITYCSGGMCDASTDAANVLVKKGFKKVSEYKGGMQDWFAGNNPTE